MKKKRSTKSLSERMNQFLADRWGRMSLSEITEEFNKVFKREDGKQWTSTYIYQRVFRAKTNGTFPEPFSAMFSKEEDTDQEVISLPVGRKP